MNSELPKNFCVVPFIHLHIDTANRAGLCCSWKKEIEPLDRNSTIDQIWASDFYQDIRQRVLNNEIIPGCEGCFQQESFGLISDRIVFNSDYQDVKFDIEQGNEYAAPLSYDLRYNNTCNLKCSMCSEVSSSQIEKEVLENLDLYHYNDHMLGREDDINFLRANRKNWLEGHIEKLKNLNHLTFRLLGGEPSLIKEYSELIDFLIANNKKDATIFITTNLTNVKFDFFEKLDYFDNVLLNVSLDGIEKYAEYIRNPLNFQSWLLNLKKLHNINQNRIQQNKNPFYITLHTVVMLLNFYHMPDFVEFFLDDLNKYDYFHLSFTNINYVFNDPLGVKLIPLEDRIEVANKINKITTVNKDGPNRIKINHVLDQILKTEYTTERTKTIEHLLLSDIPKNRSIKDYIPEVYVLIKDEYERLKIEMLEHREMLSGMQVKEYKGKILKKGKI